MGISSLDEVLDDVKHEELRTVLSDCKTQHSIIEGELRTALDSFGEDEKEPNPVAKGMSWIKTNTKLAAGRSDNTVASLITDGCDMGVKSLSKYLNKYQAADERSKNLAKRLIQLEDDLAVNIRAFL